MKYKEVRDVTEQTEQEMKKLARRFIKCLRQAKEKAICLDFEKSDNYLGFCTDIYNNLVQCGYGELDLLNGLSISAYRDIYAIRQLYYRAISGPAQ